MKSNKITFEKYRDVKARRFYKLSKDRILKEKILKATKAIRMKYLALKLGKSEEDETINRLLKPVIDPIKELKPTNSTKDKYLPVKKTSSHLSGLKSENEDEEDEDASMFENTFQDMIGEDLEQYHHIARKYIKGLYNRTNDYDETYGVRLDDKSNKLYVGNMEVQIASNSGIKIGKTVYSGKSGLYNLLFMKHPKDYDEQDLENYKEILEISNGHKRNYDYSEQINGNRSYKYTHIIKRLFKTPQAKPRSGTGLSSMIYNEKPIEYIYWDDVNELVDRLRLLEASKMSGNTDSHDNEIQAILNELLEAKVIY